MTIFLAPHLGLHCGPYFTSIGLTSISPQTSLWTSFHLNWNLNSDLSYYFKSYRTLDLNTIILISTWTSFGTSLWTFAQTLFHQNQDLTSNCTSVLNSDLILPKLGAQLGPYFQPHLDLTTGLHSKLNQDLTLLKSCVNNTHNLELAYVNDDYF